jgi:hypothetical protein
MDRINFLKSMAILPLAACKMKLQDFPKMTESLPNTERMPVLFVGHGSPMNALEDNVFTQTLKKLGEPFKKEGKKPAATSRPNPRPSTISEVSHKRCSTRNIPRPARPNWPKRPPNSVP